MRLTFVILILSLFMSSCQREEMDNTVMQQVGGDPMVRVEGSVSGYVSDENDAPVEGALVNLNGITAETNEFGYFTFLDQQLFSTGTYVTVTKGGYFHASRRFNAIEDELSNVRVKLIPKESVGTFSSNTAEVIKVDQVSISFPEGNYTTASGAAYEGEINVLAKYLDPTKDETFEEMPGNLYGINSEGNANGLATYGMVVVELESDNGELLNLPEGKNAIINMPVPASLLSSAPAIIPLWHFDETNGVWLEEGEAILEDGIYVGEVSHFTFWNCDIPLETVNICGTVHLRNVGYGGFRVRVEDQVTGFVGEGLTASDGKFSGGVPAGNLLTLYVFDPCGNTLHEEEIGPFNLDTDLGTIIVVAEFDNINVSGLVTSCSTQPSGDFLAVFDFGVATMNIQCEADGSFDFLTPPCLEGVVNAYGIDVSNNLVSPASTHTFTGDLFVGTLIACDELIQEDLIINYDNKNWGSVLDSTLVGVAVEIDSFIDPAVRIDFGVQIIDWNIYDPNLGLTQFSGSFEYDEGSDVAELSGVFASQGFEVSGNATVEKINQVGDNFMHFTFTTSEVVVIDSSLFPGDVGEVEIDILVRY